MADTSIHKAYVVNGWTLSISGTQWRAVNKHGQIGYANGSENLVIRFAKENNAKTKM